MRKISNPEQFIENILDTAEKRLHESEKANHKYNYDLMNFIHDVMSEPLSNTDPTFRITAEEAEVFLKDKKYDCIHDGKYFKCFMKKGIEIEKFFWLASAPR